MHQQEGSPEYREQRAMKRILYISIMIATVFASTSLAQEAEQERDPFFADGPRSSHDTTSRQDGEWGGRDPFTRPFGGNAAVRRHAQGTRAMGKKLTGIIYSKDARLAIIGGEVHKEGSTVGDRKLAAIHERSVVLMNSAGGSEEFFLEDFSIRKEER